LPALVPRLRDAFDQATVGEEVLDGGEAIDVADLVEDGHAQMFTDARYGLQEGIVAGGDVLGGLVELLFQSGDLRVEMADHGHVVLEGDLSQWVVFGGQ
jgi:hypothetical protein